MARPKKYNPNGLYFSSRLKAKLTEILSAGVSVVEAPSGYGKTTALRHFSKNCLPRGATGVWHVCREEPPASAWKRFAGTIRKIDADAGNVLLRLGRPEEHNVNAIIEAIQSVSCTLPHWLLVDDFHYLESAAPTAVWNALLGKRYSNLHLVVITQPLAALDILPGHPTSFLYLDGDDFRLRREEATEYFTLTGLRLTTKQLREVYQWTEGWFMALYLYALHYMRAGEGLVGETIRELLQKTVWEKLDEKERRFLLSISPFDNYTYPQAMWLLDKPSLPAYVRTLGKNSFIHYDQATRSYQLHSTLLEFIREMFSRLNKRQRNEILYRAGDWCADNGRREMAMSLYHRVGDYERILALDLAGMEESGVASQLLGMSYADLLRDIVVNCTPDMKRRHPQTMLQLAFELFGQGCYSEFRAICGEMDDFISEAKRSDKKTRKLQGELALLKSFVAYNDIAAMGELIQKAGKLMNGTPSLIKADNSWTFGNASVLFMYHSRSGRLDDELADMAEHFPIYTAVAGGHGSGADALMRAEASFCRGEMDEAEIRAHNARLRAKAKKQTCISIAVELLAGRLAVQHGNVEGFAAALTGIVSHAKDDPQKANQMEADMARSFLMGLLGRPQDMAEWLAQGDIHEKRLFTAVIPFAQVLFGRYLLLAGKPDIWLGLVDDALGLAETLHCSLGMIYEHIYSSAAWEMRGKRCLAMASLETAVVLASPDHLYLPFVENLDLIGKLWPKNGDCFASAVRRLAREFESGRNAIVRKLYGDALPFGMTKREYETAILAAEGFSINEIMVKMNISANTVKTHLKIVYQKSGATNRASLRRIFQESGKITRFG